MSAAASSRESVASCALCVQAGGEVLWDDGFARIVMAEEPDHPAFCRVILNSHRKEMTDLAEVECARLMNLVYVVERALREMLQPDKINLASLGNMVPHLHWHVVPRFSDDPHFPGAVWGPRARQGAHALPAGFARTLKQKLADTLGRQP